MYWVFQTHIFTWRNKYVQAKLVDPMPIKLKDVYEKYGFRSPMQEEPYGVKLQLTYQIDLRHSSPDNYFENAGFRLYSERLIRLMESFGVRAEYFPVSIIDRQSNVKTNPNYFVFHSLEGVLPAMDEVKSGWTGDRDSGIHSLVLDYYKFPHRPLFLCDKIYLPLMRDDLKQAIIEQSITGFEFLNPARYKSGKYGSILHFDE